MNGARGIAEMLAQKRMFFGGLPAMAEENKREIDMLTLNAADLLPVELPWTGTPHSPLALLETPSRQLIPFSPFDSSLGDANMLVMAKSGGGKTFMAQLFLLMMARANPLISILERGDSYRPLVELMGGRTIDVSFEGTERQGTLKTLKESDNAVNLTLGVANQIEDGASQAAPGSAPFLTATAVAASIRSQAITQKMLAADLRQEAARLAHMNTAIADLMRVRAIDLADAGADIKSGAIHPRIIKGT